MNMLTTYTVSVWPLDKLMGSISGNCVCNGNSSSYCRGKGAAKVTVRARV
jgi:hypothetical protein